MKKMIRFYRDRKITTKLLIIFCLFLLVPSICTFLWTYERSIHDIAQFISGSALQHYNQTYDYLLNKLDSVKEEADTLAGNPEFKRIVSQNREEYSDYQQVDDMYNLDNILNSYQNRLNVTKTVIYISEGLIYSDRMRIRPFESVENADWYQDFSARRSSTAFYASGDLWGKGAFLVRKIPHPMHYNQIVCMIRMEISNMAEILSNADISEACLTYIVDESGELVGVSNPEVAQTLELDMLEELPSSEKFTEMEVGGRRMFCIARDLPGTAWTMVSLLPYQVLDEISRSQVTTSFVVLLVMIVFIMLAIILISHTLLRKIEAVMDRMRSVENGEFKPMPACMEGHDEAGALTQTYNEMVYTIRRLMIQQEQTHQQLRTAEGQALQAQIKPHFLYNTLEMIGWLNRVGRDEDVQFAIESLGRYLCFLKYFRAPALSGEARPGRPVYSSVSCPLSLSCWSTSSSFLGIGRPHRPQFSKMLIPSFATRKPTTILRIVPPAPTAVSMICATATTTRKSSFFSKPLNPVLLESSFAMIAATTPVM